MKSTLFKLIWKTDVINTSESRTDYWITSMDISQITICITYYWMKYNLFLSLKMYSTAI